MFTQFPPRATRTVLIGIAAMTVYMTMIFVTLPQLEAWSGQSPFDMRPTGYDKPTAEALLSGLNAVGRQYYLDRQLVLDLFYPALLALLLSNLFWLIGLGVIAERYIRFGVILSWGAASFDYIENGCIAAMLILWPELPDFLIGVASAATISKSALTSIAFVSLLCLSIYRVCHRRLNRPMI